MSLALDTILSDIEAQLEVTVEIDSAKRSDGTLRTWYFSTRPRATGPGETPANTEFFPYLVLGGILGPLSQSLTEDSLFSGLAANNPGTVTIVQYIPDIDQLSVLNDYVFAGYALRIKIGRVTDIYELFETLRTTTVNIDPAIQLGTNGLQATFQLSGALTRMLEEPLKVKRYLGIPHCFRFLTAVSAGTATKVAIHDAPRFTVGVKFRISAAPSIARRLWSKGITNPSSCHWWFQVETSGKVRFSSSSNTATDINYTSIANLCDTNWHTIIFSRDNDRTAYILIDSVRESSFTPAGPTDLSNTNLIFAGPGSGCTTDIVDFRLLDRYMTPDEAISYFSVRGNGDDLNIIGMWRFDDNSGAVANDYSSVGADATFTGVVNTDYKWFQSDLGEPEMAGRPYPLIIGNVLNVEADLIDTNRERYRANTDAVDFFTSGSNSILVVRSQGTVLTGGGVSYVTDSSGGDGVFNTVSTEDEPITFDHLNNGTAEETTYLSSISQALLNYRIKAAIDVLNYEPLMLLCPWPGGYSTKDDTTAAQALQSILGQSGMHYREDVSGALWIDALIPPTGYGPYGEPCLDLWGRQNAGIDFGNVGGIGGSCTLCCWVKIAVNDQTAYNFGSSEPNVGSAYLIAKPNTAGNYALYFQSIGANAGKLAFRIAGTTLYSPVGIVTPFVWHFVAAVFDDGGNTMKIYSAPQGSSLIEVASGSNSSSPTTNSNSLKIGGTGYPWISIQHVEVWREAKNLAAIQALMTTPPVGNESNLMAYAPINEGRDDPVEIVNSVTGTVSVSIPEEGLPRWCPKMTVNLDETPSVKLTDFHHPHPAGDIIVKYAKNQFPMSEGDIDTGVVSQNDRINLTRQWNDVRLENVDIKSRFKSAKRIVMESAILDSVSAMRLLRLLAGRFGTDNYIGSLTFPPGLNISRLAVGLDIGEEIAVVSPIPSQLVNGMVFKVVSVSPNPLQLSTNIVIWR